MTRDSLDPLAEALRSLPRQQASDGFTEEVMRRLDESSTQGKLQWVRPLLAVAATVMLVAGLYLVDFRAAPASNQQNARLEELETERQRLERELAEIRSLASQTSPREIYLGGNDRVEVFFDVGWSAVLRADSQGRRSGIQPASHPLNQGAEI